MDTPRITEQFNHWLKLTYNKTTGIPQPGSEQWKQLRFAFFSGFASYHLVLLKIGENSDEEGVRRLARYETEVTGFLDSEVEAHKKAKG